MRKSVMFGVMALTLAGPVVAQDFSMPGTSPMDLAPQSQALTSSVIGNISVGNTARRGGGRGGYAAGAAAGAGVAAAGGLTSAKLSDARLPFVSTAATRKQAVDDYLARAQRKSPAAVKQIGAEIRRRDIGGEMRSEMAKYGLRADDAADVMTAFLIVGWETMNGRDVTAGQARGIRRQVAGNLVGNPAMRNPAGRARFGEELKITTYVLAAGAGAARQEGNVAQFRRGIANFYRQQTGENIGGWQVTNAGFRR